MIENYSELAFNGLNYSSSYVYVADLDFLMQIVTGLFIVNTVMLFVLILLTAGVYFAFRL